MKKAFTLVELLLVIAILAIISTILTAVIVRYNFFYQRQQLDITASIDNRLILDDMAANARQGVNIVADLTVDGNTFTTSATTLILALPTIDQFEQTIFGVSDYVLYYQDSTDPKLLRKLIVPDTQSKRPAASQILTSNLKTIDFAYNNADPQQAQVLTVILETSKTEAGQERIAKDTIQVKLRNL